MPPHVFEAQYQQRPRYGGSGCCSIERLIRYDQKPRFELTVHAWDIAATKGSGDWTVCRKFGLARDEESGDVMYLTEIIRMQIELPDVREAIITQDVVDEPALIVMDGRPKVPLGAVRLANPLWGAPRIHGELLKLGIDIGQTSVQTYGKAQETPISRVEDVPSQPRRSDRLNGSLRRSDTLVSTALRLAHSMPRPPPNLMAGSDGTPDRRMDGPATHRSLRLGMDPKLHRPRSRPGLRRSFYPALRAMGIRDRPTAPQSPWQNGHTERLIGSIRRECLDHIVVFGERHLRHLLLSYMEYYNGARTHLSLNKDAPVAAGCSGRWAHSSAAAWMIQRGPSKVKRLAVAHFAVAKAGLRMIAHPLPAAFGLTLKVDVRPYEETSEGEASLKKKYAVAKQHEGAYRFIAAGYVTPERSSPCPVCCKSKAEYSCFSRKAIEQAENV